MRIAYLCADRGIPVRGGKGASAHVRSITSALARAGHAVLLACARDGGENELAPDVEVARLPEREADHRRALVELLGEWGADAVLERLSLSSGPAHEAAGALGIPLVLEVNAPLVDEAVRFRGLDGARARRRVEAELLRGASRVVAVSGGVAAHARACGVAGERIAVIPNGVDVDRFSSARRHRRVLPASPVIGFCGSLKPWHGVLDLVEAAASLPAAARLLIVGDGPGREAIEARAEDLGLRDRVTMTGTIPQAAVPARLAEMDVAAAPYAPMPGFYFSSLKVLEYLAAGLPVVATRQGDLAALEPAALLVPPGRPDLLAGALSSLLADAELRERMSGAGPRLAQERSWARVAEAVAAVLRGAVDERAGAIA